MRSLNDECPNCGAPVAGSAQCRYCGKALQPRAVVPAASPAKADPTEFEVVLTGVPVKGRLGVIKAVQEISGGGLKLKGPAKDVVDQINKHLSLPTVLSTVVKQGVSRHEAETVVKKLRDAGGAAEIRPV